MLWDSHAYEAVEQHDTSLPYAIGKLQQSCAPASHRTCRIRRLKPLWTLSALALTITIYVCLQIFSARPAFFLPSKDIPDILHMIRFEDPRRSSDFSFTDFLSIYSAHLHLRPSKILIYTNTDPDTDTIRRNNLQMIRRIPNVAFQRVALRHTTSSGMNLTGYAHESDFLRTKILMEKGGLYMDHDSFLIKDIRPLLRTGFNNVLARQNNSRVACGLMMSQPNSALMASYHRLQDLVYDDRWWDRHSVGLLDRLSQVYSKIPGEVLILDQQAFFPLHWEADGLATLFAPQVGQKGLEYVTEDESDENNDVQTVDNLIAEQIEKFDFIDDITARSYTLHGFFSALQSMSSEVKLDWFGEQGSITPSYILQSTSLFATQLRPVLQHAISNEFFTL